MIKTELNRQLMISLGNEVGALADITHDVSADGINIIALCAYATGDRAAIMFVTDDNNAAKKILEEQEYEVHEEEVVLLTLDDKPGTLQRIVDAVARAGINMTLMYGSSAEGSQEARIVLISDSNLDIMMLVKTELERG